MASRPIRPVRKCAIRQSSAERSPVVVVDASLEDMMKDDAGEFVKLCSRINRVNKFSKKRFPLHFTGIRPDGAVQTHLMRNGYQKWPVQTSNEHFMELFDRERLIFLTTESDNVIETLEPNHIYVLGGLIDHNMHGEYFHHLAELFNIQHARLSLLEHVIVNDSTVLRIDHVFDMLLGIHAGKTLKQTLMNIQPSVQYASAALKVEANSDAPIVNLPMESRQKWLNQREMFYEEGSPQVIVDLSIDIMLSEEEAAICVKQLALMNKINRGAKKSIPLSLTGIGLCEFGSVKNHILQNPSNLEWAVKYTKDHFWNLFDPKKMIYLTNASDNVVGTLEREHFYVIGGLINHIQQAKFFLFLAKCMGIRHARLPLDDYLKVNSRTVIALNHVFEMLLNVNAGKDWHQTILSVLPATVKQERNN